MSNKSPIIGIDLGTTCCCVAYLNSKQIVEIIENKEGRKTTPSYVAFTDGGQVIGRAAKKKTLRIPENVVYDAKRLIGLKLDKKILQSVKKHNWPFKVTSDADDNPVIEISCNGKIEKYNPQEISAILLKYMKTIAEDKLDKEVKDAVITVPAHFNYHQRTATQEAGKLAGLNVLKIINEPTAAALAYVHKNEISGGTKNILVFDLGGGTFDVSIVTVEEQSVTVKTIAGNTALGGRDFDNNLLEFIVDKIEKLHKKKIKTNDFVMRRIRERSEALKIDLSSDTTTHLDLQNLVDGADVCFEVTRSDFDQINSELYQICIDTVEDCLRDAKMSKPQIDKVVLVGGSTRIPKIQEMLMKLFGGKQLTKAINADEAVAYGAVIQGTMLNKGDKTEVHYKVNDVTPLSLGIYTMGGLMYTIIPRNSEIPISKNERFLTSYNNQKSTMISIYEGERPLVQHNTLLGTTVVKHPTNPTGFPFDVTFHLDANGILEVSAKNEDGDYTSLAIEYEKSNIQTTSDILKEADINREKDGEACNVIEKWNDLEFYCTKMETLCDYDKNGIKIQDTINIKTICKNIRTWLDTNQVKDGSPQEEVAILEKSQEIEGICEPIVNSHGYHVKYMSREEFYELITK